LGDGELGEADAVHHRRAFKKDDHRVRARRRTVSSALSSSGRSDGGLREGNVSEVDPEHPSGRFGGAQLRVDHNPLSSRCRLTTGRMRQPSRIEKEQAELLLALVEAYRRRREPFAVIEVMNAMGHVLVRHPGFTEEMSVPPNDLRMLEREGFLLVTERGRGIRFLIPTPEAQEFYRSVKTERSTPIARVETEVRQFLSSSAMDFYPRAFAAWRRSESLYRQLDAADPRLSEIGHQCREAIQAFAAELAKRHRVTEIDPDPTKTINRVTAVLRARTGDTVAEFLDALIDYWRKLTSLVQRQEHSGQKEGRPVDLEDARLVVFQTLMVMYEVHRAASRA